MFLVLPSPEMQKRIILIKVLYYVSKSTSHEPLKVAAAKMSFPSVFIIDATCFDESFSFHVITANNIFCTTL